jgi:leucyl-tRNA synthetase
VRLFILSDSPPEKDVQWSEEGIAASHKFVQKLWTLHLKILEEIEKDHPKDQGEEFTKFTNKFIKKISNNLENFSYNIIVANLHEMHSFLVKEIDKGYQKKTILKNYKKILITMNPILPHLSSECLEIIEENNEAIWPKYDEKQLKESSTLIVIQINGKKRGLINTNLNVTEKEIMELIYKDEKISKYLIDSIIKKQIYIKNKLINIII